jgi:hypothetical protein
MFSTGLLGTAIARGERFSLLASSVVGRIRIDASQNCSCVPRRYQYVVAVEFASICAVSVWFAPCSDMLPDRDHHDSASPFRFVYFRIATERAAQREDASLVADLPAAP